MRGTADRKISGGAEIFYPFKIEYFIGVFAGYFFGIIGGARIYNDNFKRVGFERFQTFLQMLGFIFGNDTYGNRNHGGCLLFILDGAASVHRICLIVPLI